MYSRRDAGDSIRVQISADNGNTWTNVYVNKTTSIGGYSNFVLQTISLNAYINMPALLLRFHFGAANDFFWAIDNVKVTGIALPTAYSWSSAPAGFTSSLQNPTAVIPVLNTTYKVIATNSNGCSDSNYVAVMVKAVSSSSTSLSVCSSALPYSWNGLSFNTAGTQTAHLTNSVGCDSAASLILSVRSLSTSSGSIAVCQSALPYIWNGLTFNGAGTQTAQLLNSVGCDSAATLTLTINPSPANLVANASSTSFCQGTSINLSSSSSSGITTFVLNENFNAPTNNWTTINASTGGNAASTAWTLWPNGSSIHSNDNSQFYLSLNINLDYGGVTHTTLQSPSFSTVGLADASLSFYHSYSHNPYDWDSIRVQVSPDNGVTWNTIYLNNSTDVGTADIFVLQTIPLNGFLNKPNVKIRFNYNAAWYTNWWAIDNVKVGGSPVNNYSWTSSPVGFTSTLQNPTGITPTQTTTYTVAVTNSGGCTASINVPVTVRQPTTSITDSSICIEALPFNWNGLTFNAGGTQVAHILNAVGCDSTATLNLTVKAGKTWAGGAGNWSVASNWCGGLPASGDSISIPTGSPVLDLDFTSTGTLTLSGSGMLTINPLKTLTIAGTADFGGKSVIIRSDSTGSGSIGTITGILNNATNVTIERYIQNYGFPSWRLLSAPTYGNGQTIRQAWQEGTLNPGPFNNNLPGYGTLIFNTGTQASVQAAGFDDANASSSLLNYNGTAFQGLSATNTPIATKEGYSLFVRGDRSVGVSSPVNNATILRTTGTVYQGYQTTPTITGNSLGLVGNIYPSAINFTSLGRSGGTSDHFYTWDAKKSVGNSIGLYQTFSATNGYECLIPGGSYSAGLPHTVIQSGQAFFVETSGSAGSLTFPEDSKLAGNGSVIYNSTAGLIKLESRLYKGISANAGMADANAVVFDVAYSNAVNGDDATKLANTGENMGILQNNKTLTIEGRQPVTSKDTIFFKIWNMQAQVYRFEFVPRNMAYQNLTANLEDSYLGSSTRLNLSDTNRIDFEVDANPASYAVNRFRIVFVKMAGDCLGSSKSFIAASSGTTYQWQVDTGTGYANITEGGIYSGTTTATLQLTNVPTSYTGYKYRAVVNGINGPDNILRFELTWSGTESTDWATPANWSCPTQPDEYTDVIIPTGMSRYPIINVATSVRKLTAMPGAIVTVKAGVNLDIKGK